MLVDNSAIKKAVTDAVDALESAGAESALDALIDVRDECESRIDMERGLGRSRAVALGNIYVHWSACHAGDSRSIEKVMACQYCLDLAVKLKETLP